MKIFNRATVLSFLILLPASAYGEAVPSVRLAGVSYAGQGCPFNSVTTGLSDHSTINMQFQDLVSTYDMASGIRGTRKNCQVAFDLDFPADWSFALSEISGDVIGRLNSRQSGKLQIAGYRSGVRETSTAKLQIRGPLDGLTAFSTPFQPLLWSPCGHRRSLSLNMATYLDVRGQQWSFFGLSAPDPDLIIDQPELKLHLVWKRCR